MAIPSHCKACEFCGLGYVGVLHQRFCSSSCAAKAVPRKQTLPAFPPSTEICPGCGASFIRGGRSKERQRKYCSKTCVNVARGNALRESKKHHAPRPKRGRKQFNKLCSVCGSTFLVDTKKGRQTYCSRRCGSINGRLGTKQFVDKSIIETLIEKHGTISAASRNSDYSYHVLRRRAAEFGIKQAARRFKVRSDGYWGYTNPNNHRRVMERHIGRALASREGVHHIDLNKLNNEIDNLIVTSGTSEHAQIHDSLEKCAAHFLKLGMVSFDKSSKRYFISKSP